MAGSILKPLITIDDLCDFIKVRRGIVIYYAFRLNIDAQYYSFMIPRRTGGTRLIHSPAQKLQMIQKAIARSLTEIYTPRVLSSGFVKGRNTFYNATPHVNARWVLNLDLENFFPSINFGRVRGLFLGYPFNASPTVATALARICCHQGALPVGTPTSPIISNLICRKLDQALLSTARNLNLKVSRYADDITFSSRKNNIPPGIALLSNGGVYQPGEMISKIVSSNGFTIHPNKFKIRTRENRQEVTGLVVNRFVNLKREYIRNIWQIIHAWRKFGLDAVATEHFRKFRPMDTLPTSDKFRRVMAGRVAYVRSIRGVDDPIYLKIARALREICPEIELPAEQDITNHYEKIVWVHDAVGNNDDFEAPFQGTVFNLEEFGFCGAYHCVGAIDNKIYPPKSKITYDATVVKYDKEIDWVRILLKESFIGPPLPAFKAAKYRPSLGQKIRVLGYPKWGKGSSITIQNGEIIGANQFNNIDRFKINCTIVTGNSGGPVLDEQDRVLGIAIKGNEAFSSESGDGENLFIPVDYIRK